MRGRKLKRGISLLLSMAMIVTMLPQTAISAKAAEEAPAAITEAEEITEEEISEAAEITGTQEEEEKLCEILIEDENEAAEVTFVSDYVKREDENTYLFDTDEPILFTVDVADESGYELDKVNCSFDDEDKVQEVRFDEEQNAYVIPEKNLTDVITIYVVTVKLPDSAKEETEDVQESEDTPDQSGGQSENELVEEEDTLTADELAEEESAEEETEEEEAAEELSSEDGAALTIDEEEVLEESISENSLDSLTPVEEEPANTVAEESQVIISVKADTAAVSVSARKGAQTLSCQAVEDGFQFAVDKDASLNVTVTVNDNYAITGVTTQSGKASRVKATGFSYTVTASQDDVTKVETKALYKGVLKQNGTVVESSKNTYTVNANEVYQAEVLCGNQTAAIAGKNVEVQGNKDNTATAVVENNQIALTIAAGDAGNTKLKLVVKSDAGDVLVTFPLNVRPALQTVKVAGANGDVLKQALDTVKDYKVTLQPAKADMASLSVKTTGDIEAAFANGILTVTTKSKIQDTAGTITFCQQDKGVKTITVNSVTPDALTKAKPTVKAAQSTDKELVLNLSVPKTINTPAAGSQYYKITVTPDSTEAVPESIAQAVSQPFYRARNGLSQQETIVVNQAAIGQTWKFTVEVTLVQYEAGKTPADTDSQPISFSKSNRIKVSTLKPAYEMKLGMKKAGSTIYTGQSNLVVGTPVFQGKTTYRTITEVEDSTEDLSDNEKLQVAYADGAIVAAAGSDAALGKHTITAYAQAPEGCKAASVSFVVTVVRGIEDLEISAAKSVYKEYNKAATITVGLSYNQNVTSDQPQPKSKKVSYDIVDASGQELQQDNPLYGMVKVNNGKITIDKRYLVSSNSEENQFRVKVTAKDYQENGLSVCSGIIEIMSTTLSLGDMLLVSRTANEQSAYAVVSRGNEAIKLEQFNTSRLVVLKNGVSPDKKTYTEDDFADISLLSLTSGNKALQIAADGTVSADQAVRNVSITAETQDGSKTKATLSGLTLDYTEARALGANISRETYPYQGKSRDFYTIASPDNLYVTYQGSSNEMFKVEVLEYGEDDNWQEIDSSKYMNYTLSVSGGKEMSREKDTYLIMATAAETKITITDNANKKSSVYRLVNKALDGNKLPSFNVSTNEQLAAGYYESTQSITLQITPGNYKYYDEEDGSTRDVYAEVKVDADTAKKNREQYDSFLNATTEIDGCFSLSFESDGEYDEEGNLLSSTTTASVEIYFDKENYTDIQAGKYKLNITLGTVGDDGQFVAETQTKSLTVSAVEPKKRNLSFKPTTSYQITPAENIPVYLEGTLNDEEASYKYTAIHNAVINGTANAFTDYFEVIPAQNRKGLALKLKQGVDYDWLMQDGKDNCVAYADYNVYDKQGVLFKTDSVKINVNVSNKTSSLKVEVLPVMLPKDTSSTGGTTFTTQVIATRDGKRVNIAYAMVIQKRVNMKNDTTSLFTASADGSSVVSLTYKNTEKITKGQSLSVMSLYLMPEGSCYEEQLAAYQEAKNTDAIQDILKNHGFGYICNVKVSLNETTRVRNWIKVSSSGRMQESYFSREETASGVYEIPYKYTRLYAMTASDVSLKLTEVSTGSHSTLKEADNPELFKNSKIQARLGTDSSGADMLYVTADKAELYDLILECNSGTDWRMSGKMYLTFVLSVKGYEDTQEISLPITFTGSSYARNGVDPGKGPWQTYKNACSWIEKQYVNVHTPRIATWTGDAETTIAGQYRRLDWTLSKYVPYDSDAVLTYTIDEDSIVPPTRTTEGSMKLTVTLTDTMAKKSAESEETASEEQTTDAQTVTQKTYDITLRFLKLGAWPEDIAEELNTYLTDTYATAYPLYNDTVAEEIAANISEQRFITENSHLKVDVTKMKKVKATNETPGSCTVTVRVMDTTGGGTEYKKEYTWAIVTPNRPKSETSK